MKYFNNDHKMKYLTDKKLSLNAKGLLSVILFQENINIDKLTKFCIDDSEEINYALLELRFHRYIKYNVNTGKTSCRRHIF